jgi:hypothetical protein
MKISHKQLNILGEKFLKGQKTSYKYKCQITRVELVSAAYETPDVIGFFSGGSVVIESKASRQDFFRDKTKNHRQFEGLGDMRFFLSEEKTINVTDLYDDWGLLHTDGDKVWVVKPPTYRENRNRKADCVIMYSIIRRLEKELKSKKK